MKKLLNSRLTKTFGVFLLGSTLLFLNTAEANPDTLKAPRQPPPVEVQGMNNDKLGKILRENSRILEGTNGYWQVQYIDRVLTIVTDASHNRMRIMTAVIHQKNLKTIYSHHSTLMAKRDFLF